MTHKVARPIKYKLSLSHKPLDNEQAEQIFNTYKVLVCNIIIYEKLHNLQTIKMQSYTYMGINMHHLVAMQDSSL